MQEENSVGAARIDIIVDGSQIEVATAKAKNRLADMSQAAQAEYAKLDQSEKRRVQNLLKQADTIGFTKEQQVAYNAALKTSGPILDEINRRLAQNATALNGGGMSAKAYSAAMRGLPAQITDIVTSLQGGQKPLTVLFQQGGQLKDMFGGVLPATEALATGIMGMVNPLTVSAAAVGALALAWKQAADEQFDFQKALLTTGNYAGVSLAEFAKLADQLERLDGVGHGGAVDALTQVAATGKFRGELFRQVSIAAAEMEVSTGQAVDKTIEKFALIAKDPVDGLLKLNEAEHFVTAAQMARVEALVQEGDKQQAVTAAVEIYFDRLDEVAKKSNEAMPDVVRWWRELKADVSNASGELSHFISLMGNTAAKGGSSYADWFDSKLGKAKPAATGPSAYDDLVAWMERYTRHDSTVGTQSRHSPGRTALDAVIDTPEYQKDQEANKSWDQLVARMDKAKALEREIADIRVKGIAAHKTDAEIEQQITAARKRYSDELAKQNKPKANADLTSAKSLLASLDEQIKANDQLAASGEKVTQTDRLADRARAMAADSTKKLTVAERNALITKAALAEASDNAARLAESERKAKEALARQTAALNEEEQARRAANAKDLMSLGQGADATTQMERQIALQMKYAQEMKRLGDRGVAEDQASWDRQAANAKAYYERALAEEEDYQRARVILMKDWRTGARAAWEDYAFNAANASEQTKSLLTDAFTGAEDAFVKFVQTGKLSFTDLANSIIADLARVQAKQAITGLFGSAFNAILGSTIGGVTKEAIPTSSALSIDKIPITMNANGGVYATPSLHAYANTVVDKPTAFAFAKGGVPSLGWTGEAGPEAIMPLKRTSNGRLGVEVATGGGSSGMQVQINNYGSSKVEARQETTTAPDGKKLARLVIDIVDESLNGGRLGVTGKRRYGWKEVV